MPQEDLQYRITMLESQRDELKQSVNMGAIEEYKKKDTEYKERASEVSGGTDRVEGSLHSLIIMVPLYLCAAARGSGEGARCSPEGL